MKRLLIIAILLSLTASVIAQKNYKYVIIPTTFSGISSGLDPYGVSSSLQKILNKKSIKSVFKQNELPEDYCETLTAHVEKLPNVFKSKLKVEFRDCRNQTIWSAEGMGVSKAFREGYAEAIEAALKNFEVLPVNQSQQYVSSPKVVESQKPQEKPVPTIKPVVEKVVIEEVITQNTERIYKPTNLYYNYNYFIDLIENENGSIELMVINGELLGYKNLQIVATLNPSGLENVYTVEWLKTNDSKLTGVANLANIELKISLQDGDKKLVIQLQKY